MEKDENSNRNLTDDNSVEKKLKSARNEGRKNGALISGLIGIVIILALIFTAYGIHKRDHEEQLAMMENQRITLTKQLTERDSTINDWLMTFDKIEKDLGIIKEKENMITMKSSGSELTKDKKEQVLADVRDINTLLDNNRRKIASLNAQLKNSNGALKGLQARIEDLDTTLKQYEVDMADLRDNLSKKDFQLNQLNVKMAALDETVTKQDETIQNQTDKLNQAFLASGTYKELKEKGIMEKEGGFLGLGRTGTLVPNPPEKSFSKIDIMETKTIPVHSREAKLITKHPSDSYVMVPGEGKNIAYIEIKDPENFWKISKYAVVEISK